ncbi:MAG: hypothetical protein AB1348_09255 [Nitrospirota bacterium]
MIKRILILIILGSLLNIATFSYPKEVSFTQEDRDRLIRLEVKVEQLEKHIDQIDRRIERLENVMMWGFGLLFTTIIGLVGFVIWDRRTALAPASLHSPPIAEVLKHVGLL